MPEPRTSPRRVEARLKQAQALEMRLEGRTLAEIAEALGYSGPPGAAKALSTALTAVIAGPVEELRALENSRYDAVQGAIWDKVKEADLEAVHAFLRLSHRRCKLNGLDMPIRIAQTDSEGNDNPFMELTGEELRAIAIGIVQNTPNPG